MKKFLIALLCAGFSVWTVAQDMDMPADLPVDEDVAEMNAQTKCICGKDLSEDKVAVEVDGQTIYACSEACAEKVKEDPEKALAMIQGAGEETEDAYDEVSMPEPPEAPEPLE
ncbi:MAG: hypothetical protein JW774_07725 [Candidatus Aureabacteria bacterium]|nr:hypothetical protein [Candidatus Auribacterota bacterium]